MLNINIAAKTKQTRSSQNYQLSIYTVNIYFRLLYILNYFFAIVCYQSRIRTETQLHGFLFDKIQKAGETLR